MIIPINHLSINHLPINIEHISRLESKQGQEITGSLISIQVQTGAQNTISIGSITKLANIPVLGITGNNGKNYSEDTPNGNRILTENNSNDSLFVEIELTDMINQELQETFDADGTISIVINQGGISDDITVYPSSIEWIVQYDQINRRVLHFELV